MAATETRLLVLGAVALFEPVNGYQIRRELMSWEVDRWAHINPGSIYSSLGTLTKQHHLERHDVVDGSREVAVYTSTESGRAELTDLFAGALETVELLDALPLHTALSMCPLFDRELVAHHLARRLDALDVHLRTLREKREAAAASAPPHVARVVGLQISTGEVELAWVRDVLAEIRAGGLAFAGEPARWRPAPDDPGWQMAADRERYRRLLRSSGDPGGVAGRP
jgi:DNA-binding PadR family transcriptional regulator